MADGEEAGITKWFTFGECSWLATGEPRWGRSFGPGVRRCGGGGDRSRLIRRTWGITVKDSVDSWPREEVKRRGHFHSLPLQINQVTDNERITSNLKVTFDLNSLKHPPPPAAFDLIAIPSPISKQRVEHMFY